MEEPGPERILPVEAWTNGRHGVIYAAAYGRQITLLMPNGTIVELQLGVFRQMMLRLLIAAYSAKD